MASAAARNLDLIDVRPRFTSADVKRLNDRFGHADTATMLRELITGKLIGNAAVVSSFGAESAVLLHMIAQIDRAFPILFLDTGKMFDETLAYRDALVARLGLNNVQSILPDAVAIAARDETGLRWSYDPDGCCDIRKVIPLAKALAPLDASITGRKGFQSSTRTGLARFELDDDRLKVNPLASWTKQRLDDYFKAHDLPAHPLVAQGFPSIGCQPCTSRVQDGEDPRAGRWRGWDKVECGIHTSVSGGGEADDPAF